MSDHAHISLTAHPDASVTYVVYMVVCADKTLYTGITNNLTKRMTAHNAGKAGARYTRARRPVELVYCEFVGGRGLALSREAAIKRLSRTEKMELCRSWRMDDTISQ